MFWLGFSSRGRGQGFIQYFCQDGANAVIVILGGEGEDYIVVCLGFYTKFVGEGIV